MGVFATDSRRNWPKLIEKFQELVKIQWMQLFGSHPFFSFFQISPRLASSQKL
jgi:hypothetical protein